MAGCFVAGTSVDTPAGQIAIEDLKIGDLVWAHDPLSGAPAEPREVVDTSALEVAGYYVLTFDDQTVISVTAEHPFWTPEEKWVAVKDLQQSDRVVTLSGAELQLTGKEYVAQATTVYNVTVDNLHTYFVGDSAILVHNTCMQGYGGRYGGASHIDTLADEISRLREKSGSLGVLEEVFFRTPGGYKNSRFMDAIVLFDDGTAIAIQVGRKLKKPSSALVGEWGSVVPVMRERKAIWDMKNFSSMKIHFEGENYKVKEINFIPYN